MRKGLFLLSFLLLSNCVVFCQVGQDSTADEYTYQLFVDGFSIEESWEIRKEAYLKKLKKQGLSKGEIQKKIKIYEKQKEEFIAHQKEQIRLAEIQRAKADIERAKAEEQRKLADFNRRLAVEQREKAEEQRELAEVVRALAEEQRKLADISRRLAEEQRKLVMELRNSFKTFLKEQVVLSREVGSPEPILFKIDKKTTLLISIKGKVTSGAVLIEIFNPKGVKKATLSLEHDPEKKGGKGESSNYASCFLNKTISDSKVGEWQIKITSKKAEGKIDMSLAKYVKPAKDE